MNTSVTIAYVGLGIMGRPAASLLLKAGYRVRVYSRRTTATQPLVELGATAHASAATAAQGASFAFTNVSDTQDVEEVIFGPQGLAAGLAPGSIVVDMSTIAPKMARQLGAKLATQQIGFIDAPVSGGQAGAQAGTLAFMCGGTEEDFAKVVPVLQVMGSTMVLVGDCGAGQVAKCVNQILIGATVSAVAESFRLSRAMDVDPAKVRDAIAGGFAGSKVLEVHAKRILENNYAPGFKAHLHLKDINIALATAADCGVKLPAAIEFRNRLVQVVADGKGEFDSSISATALD